MLEKSLLNEQYIRSIVQEEIESKEVIHKHILNVEETDETIIVTYAKPSMKEEEEEEEERDLEDDEDTEEMAYKEDDEEEDSKDDKSYFDGISKYIATLL